jgi:hypothetical protein
MAIPEKHGKRTLLVTGDVRVRVSMTDVGFENILGTMGKVGPKR